MTTRIHSVENTKPSGRWTGRGALLLGAGLLLALLALGEVIWFDKPSLVPNQEALAQVDDLLAIDLSEPSTETIEQPIDEVMAQVEPAPVEGAAETSDQALNLGDPPEPPQAALWAEMATFSAAPIRVDFTLRTELQGGRLFYVGVGGEIDGEVNPDLVVAPGTIVRAVLVIGDDMSHNLFFPDFDAGTDTIGSRGQSTEVTFTVGIDQIGVYDYYCTRPGHRAAGQEGRVLVVPIQ